MAVSPVSSRGGGLPLGLTGATAATRYVGGTSSGAPGSGTFAVGDFDIDQTGKMWICTAAGSPGTWAAVGGTPSATKLFDSVLGSPAASIYSGANSIPSGTLALQIFISARSSNASGDDAQIRFNTDSAGHYDWQRAGAQNTTGTFSITNNDTGLDFLIPAANRTANLFGAVTMWVPNPSAATAWKCADWTDGWTDASLVGQEYGRAGVWRSTAAITDVTLAIAFSGANLVTGSRMTIIGYS